MGALCYFRRRKMDTPIVYRLQSFKQSYGSKQVPLPIITDLFDQLMDLDTLQNSIFDQAITKFE